MNSLPQEILAHVLHFIVPRNAENQRDLLKFRLVSRYWKDCVDSEWSLRWKAGKQVLRLENWAKQQGFGRMVMVMKRQKLLELSRGKLLVELFPEQEFALVDPNLAKRLKKPRKLHVHGQPLDDSSVIPIDEDSISEDSSDESDVGNDTADSVDQEMQNLVFEAPPRTDDYDEFDTYPDSLEMYLGKGDDARESVGASVESFAERIPQNSFLESLARLEDIPLPELEDDRLELPELIHDIIPPLPELEDIQLKLPELIHIPPPPQLQEYHFPRPQIPLIPPPPELEDYRFPRPQIPLIPPPPELPDLSLTRPRITFHEPLELDDTNASIDPLTMAQHDKPLPTEIWRRYPSKKLSVGSTGIDYQPLAIFSSPYRIFHWVHRQLISFFVDYTDIITWDIPTPATYAWFVVSKDEKFVLIYRDEMDPSPFSRDDLDRLEILEVYSVQHPEKKAIIHLNYIEPEHVQFSFSPNGDYIEMQSLEHQLLMIYQNPLHSRFENLVYWKEMPARAEDNTFPNNPLRPIFTTTCSWTSMRSPAPTLFMENDKIIFSRLSNNSDLLHFYVSPTLTQLSEPVQSDGTFIGKIGNIPLHPAEEDQEYEEELEQLSFLLLPNRQIPLCAFQYLDSSGMASFVIYDIHHDQTLHQDFFHQDVFWAGHFWESWNGKDLRLLAYCNGDGDDDLNISKISLLNYQEGLIGVKDFIDESEQLIARGVYNQTCQVVHTHTPFQPVMERMLGCNLSRLGTRIVSSDERYAVMIDDEELRIVDLQKNKVKRMNTRVSWATWSP